MCVCVCVCVQEWRFSLVYFFTGISTPYGSFNEKFV